MRFLTRWFQLLPSPWDDDHWDLWYLAFKMTEKQCLSTVVRVMRRYTSSDDTSGEDSDTSDDSDTDDESSQGSSQSPSPLQHAVAKVDRERGAAEAKKRTEELRLAHHERAEAEKRMRKLTRAIELEAAAKEATAAAKEAVDRECALAE